MRDRARRASPPLHRGPRARPRKVKVTGTVTASVAGHGQAAWARITTPDGGTYTVIPDQIGLRLAEQMDGRKVVTTGAVEVDEDGTKMLTVKRFREAGNGRMASPEAPQPPTG